MTLAWNIMPRRRYSFGCRYRLGTASNLVMYVSAADNDNVGVPAPSSARPRRASGARLDSRCRRAELRSCTSEPLAAPSPGWCSTTSGGVSTGSVVCGDKLGHGLFASVPP